MVELLKDLIGVEAPEIVWVSRPIEEMKLHEGDTILRYARLGEGWADLWPTAAGTNKPMPTSLLSPMVPVAEPILAQPT